MGIKNNISLIILLIIVVLLLSWLFVVGYNSVKIKRELSELEDRIESIEERREKEDKILYLINNSLGKVIKLEADYRCLGLLKYNDCVWFRTVIPDEYERVFKTEMKENSYCFYLYFDYQIYYFVLEKVESLNESGLFKVVKIKKGEII